MSTIQPAVRPIVHEAAEALASFGGNLTYGQARTLLTMWRRTADLTAAERRAVLARFARTAGDIGDPGNSGPGW